MADKAKEVAIDEANRIKSLTTDAARSGAYLYPIRGIFYLVSHQTLWKPLMSRLIPTLSLATAVTTAMFFITYVPQAAIMAFTSGPAAAVSAFFLVLSESSTLTTMLSRTFLIQDALVDTFDGTLVSKGQDTTALVSQGRQIEGNPLTDPIQRLGRLVKRPFDKYTPTALIRYLILLPLNAIPIVGTVMFVIAQGRGVGPAAHERYFQLKGWKSEQRRKHVEEFKGAYTGFGIAAVLLDMVPVASVLFSFTNTVGAALWAADMEKGAVNAKGTSSKLKEQIRDAQ